MFISLNSIEDKPYGESSGHCFDECSCDVLGGKEVNGRNDLPVSFLDNLNDLFGDVASRGKEDSGILFRFGTTQEPSLSPVREWHVHHLPAVVATLAESATFSPWLSFASSWVSASPFWP